MIPIVVYSRCNLRGIGKPAAGIPNAAWTRERIDIYLQFALPSLRRQGVKLHPWLACRAGADSVHEVEPCRKRLEAEGVLVTFGDFGPLLAERFGPIVRWVNLDSDDIYAPGALNVLDYYAPHGNRNWLFTNGYIYDLPTGRLGKCNHRSPPFYSLVRKWDGKQWLPPIVPHGRFRQTYHPVTEDSRLHYVQITHRPRSTGFHGAHCPIVRPEKAGGWIEGPSKHVLLRRLGLC